MNASLGLPLQNATTADLLKIPAFWKMFVCQKVGGTAATSLSHMVLSFAVSFMPIPLQMTIIYKFVNTHYMEKFIQILLLQI